MKISTAFSTEPDTETAFMEAYNNLPAVSGEYPDLLIIYCTAGYDINPLKRLIGNVSEHSAVFGGTTCRGVMTEKGYHTAEGAGLGMLGISDAEGSYGAGIARISDNPGSAAVQAVNAALHNAQRPGEMPVMVLLSAFPGCEEEVISGIESVMGHSVPIFGGSSADNNVSGEWFQFAGDTLHSNSVAVAVLFPSREIVFGFYSGYEPADFKGVATRTDGRILFEIDNRPAAGVYNEWSGGCIRDYLHSGGNVLKNTTFNPLGREVGSIGDIPYYNLSHPERVNRDGSLTLFTSINDGERVFLMKGTENSLIQRPASVARASLENNNISGDDIEGAFVIFCAGSMLALGERMREVVDQLNTELKGMPFMGAFTFGEQGTFIGGESRHGNLMISIILFTNKMI